MNKFYHFAASLLIGAAISSTSLRADDFGPEDGHVYTIQNVNSGDEVEVPYASNSPGQPLDQYSPVAGATNEYWQAINIGNGYFKFVSVSSGMVLEVSGPFSSSGSGVDQNWSYDNLNQVWSTSPGANGAYYVYNVGANEYLDIAGASSDLNASVITWQYNGCPNQEWCFKDVGPIDGHTYKIRNFNSGLMLEVPYAGEHNLGQALDQYDDVSGATNEYWKAKTLTNLGPGYFEFISAPSAFVLTAPESYGSPITQFNDWWWFYPYDYWQPQPAGEGTYNLYNGGSQMYMGVAGGSTADNAPVISWGADGSDNQRWEFLDQATAGIDYGSPDFSSLPLFIESAYYVAVDGSAGADVTPTIRNLVQSNTLSTSVSNGVCGSDPAPNHVKQLDVVFDVYGIEQETIVPEGGMLTLPNPSNTGLTIVDADYETLDGTIDVDVTHEVAVLVSNNQLNFMVAPWVMGIPDPAFGLPKQLTIDYISDGVESIATVGDFQTVNIPQAIADSDPTPPPTDPLVTLDSYVLARDPGTTALQLRYEGKWPVCTYKLAPYWTLKSELKAYFAGSLNYHPDAKKNPAWEGSLMINAEVEGTIFYGAHVETDGRWVTSLPSGETITGGAGHSFQSFEAGVGGKLKLQLTGSAAGNVWYTNHSGDKQALINYSLTGGARLEVEPKISLDIRVGKYTASPEISGSGYVNFYCNVSGNITYLYSYELEESDTGVKSPTQTDFGSGITGWKWSRPVITPTQMNYGGQLKVKIGNYHFLFTHTAPINLRPTRGSYDTTANNTAFEWEGNGTSGAPPALDPGSLDPGPMAP